MKKNSCINSLLTSIMQKTKVLIKNLQNCKTGCKKRFAYFTYRLNKNYHVIKSDNRNVFAGNHAVYTRKTKNLKQQGE